MKVVSALASLVLGLGGVLAVSADIEPTEAGLLPRQGKEVNA